jgi:hypothetical protein
MEVRVLRVFCNCFPTWKAFPLILETRRLPARSRPARRVGARAWKACWIACWISLRETAWPPSGSTGNAPGGAPSGSTPFPPPGLRLENKFSTPPLAVKRSAASRSLQIMESHGQEGRKLRRNAASCAGTWLGRSSYAQMNTCFPGRACPQESGQMRMDIAVCLDACLPAFWAIRAGSR